MIKIICRIIVCVAVNLNFLLPQTVNKVLVSGEVGFEQHDTLVANAYLLGYSSYDNTAFPGTINLYANDVENSLIYASTNNYELVIRSYEGLSDALIIAADYPSIKLVMPAGSNNFEEIFTGDVINSPIIITGAGVTSNVTGYQVEFFSIDPITTDTLSSFANGYIAGQISFIANTRGCSIDAARLLARNYGSENGTFNYYNGFGTINIGKALVEPFPVELANFIANQKNDFVFLTWKTETEVNNYGFNIERSPSSNGINWKTIGFVTGNGNSNSPKFYEFTDKEIHQSSTYQYRLKQIDNDGTFEYSKVVNVNVFFPDKYYLYQNYPNPFNPETKISYSITQKQKVTLIVYNVLGEMIVKLPDEVKEAGNYSVTFDGSNLPGGIYIYRIQTDQFTSSRKMVLLK